MVAKCLSWNWLWFRSLDVVCEAGVDHSRIGSDSRDSTEVYRDLVSRVEVEWFDAIRANTAIGVNVTEPVGHWVTVPKAVRWCR